MNFSVVELELQLIHGLELELRVPSSPHPCLGDRKNLAEDLDENIRACRRENIFSSPACQFRWILPAQCPFQMCGTMYHHHRRFSPFLVCLT